MKVFTSYFYQIRHFKRNMIPISTAQWDPKWFHDFTGDYDYVFKDKRGIYNGIRCEDFHFDYDLYGQNNDACGEACKDKHPETCNFLKNYRKCLDEKDFDGLYKELERIAYKVQELEQFDEEPWIVLIVYEVPSNKCSERATLQEWFRDNGIDITELSYPIE